MANSLIFKAQPTLSIDSVERDLQNYDVVRSYTNYYETTSVIVNTSGTLSLPSPSALPTTACFIELISDQDLTLTYKLTSGATLTTVTKIKYLAGDYLAWAFTASNAGAVDANITWRIYY